MKLTELLSDENAVSPVIGVILMVAITVILAAVIGTFVLGLGDQVQTTSPQASFDAEYKQDLEPTGNSFDALVISHSGGDTIAAGQMNVSINDAASGLTDDPVLMSSAFGSSGDVSAGSTWNLTHNKFNKGDTSGDTLAKGDSLDLSGATVRLVWSANSGDSSATLKEWSGPSA